VRLIDLYLLELVRARRDELNEIVSLSKLLGGGWQQPPATK
jgi:outer membrane protein TolC